MIKAIDEESNAFERYRSQRNRNLSLYQAKFRKITGVLKKTESELKTYSTKLKDALDKLKDLIEQVEKNSSVFMKIFLDNAFGFDVLVAKYKAFIEKQEALISSHSIRA